MSVSLKDVYRQSLQLSPEDRRRLAEYLLNPPQVLDVQQLIATLEVYIVKFFGTQAEQK
jgi:hypothetical protein